MDLMVKYYIFLVLQACAIVSSVVLQESSGHTISPFPSFYGVPPIIEGSGRLVTQETQITSNLLSPTSEPNASPHFESASGPQPNNGLKPSLNEPPPSKDPGLLPDAEAPVTSIPEGSPPSPPVIPPTTPVSVPPIPQQEKGPDTTSPANPPTASVQTPPPKEALHNPPPVAQVAPSMSQVPPSIPQVPSSMPEGPPFIVPEPVASPPTKLPMASPPTRPTLPISPPNLPLPAELPPSTLPSLPPSNLSVQTPPPKEALHNPPPLAQVAPSMSQVPPSIPQVPSSMPEGPPFIVPEPVASPPTKLPMASPPTKWLMASPPTRPTLPISPPNLPLPAELPPSTLPSLPPSNLSAPLASPPSTLPRNAPPTPPTPTIPPPNFPAPLALPPSTLPRNTPPSPPTPTAPPPDLPDPLASPPSTLPKNAPPTPPPPTVPPPPNLPAALASPPSTLPRNTPPTSPPTLTTPPPNLPAAPLASPPSTLPRNIPPSPPTLNVPPPNMPAPLASPPSTLPRNSPPSSPLTRPPPSLPVPVASPPYASQRNIPPPHTTFAKSPSIYAVPPSNSPKDLPPSNSSKDLSPSNPPKDLPPRNSPKDLPPSNQNSSAPPPNIRAPIPSTNEGGNQTTNIAPTHRSREKAPIIHKAPSSYNHAPPPNSSYEPPPPTKSHPPPSLPPLYPPPGPKSKPRRHNPLPPPGPESNPKHHAPPPQFSISPSISPSVQTMPVLSPKVSPSRASSPRIPKPIQALPPPPPNEDCLSITCVEPLTNTPPGTPCNCVLPMQVELGLGVSFYTFFPLVTELASEIASGLFMRSSQVRIMGANEDTQDPEKTIVIVNLVPLGEKFDNFTALVTAQRLWSKQVPIKSSLFGDYEVLFVKYPGLPPSPPLPSSNSGMNGGPYGRGNNGRDVKPLGVDVSKQRRSNRLNGGIIAIIALSVVVAVVLVGVTVWVLLFKRPVGARSGTNPPPTFPPLTKSSGVGGSITGSGPESASLSFRSSIAYTGSAKTFSSSDMEKATDNFKESGVLGEGGFGRVYSGVLEDGTKVAVKVLKRDDQQGGREFLAEVEMLSRLHHRNLVRLIGICTEERNRCLVYELIPNGSVESHLHGVDKETAPLDWGARLKIALGAARGLAYLHEDSSPRVIHRDFKSSNILLEHDFTPKVSDFGLARTALDEDNRHISTRVMGTFGYVAPEYAMTGHLLVKSDVYSYGVVLLELLSGRKPVDMSMPSGQENLVAWARPLLPTPEGLNLLIDPSLSPEVPFDSIAKVSAIASMCVQPEVSHRPFMGEVVQALKLVCNECEETRDLGSRSCSQEDLTSVDFDPRVSTNSGPTRPTYLSYESPLDVESGFSTSGFGLDVDSYRMSSSSGPLRPQRRPQLWERMKRFSSGSLSDYGDFLRLLSRSR